MGRRGGAGRVGFRGRWWPTQAREAQGAVCQAMVRLRCAEGVMAWEARGEIREEEVVG